MIRLQSGHSVTNMVDDHVTMLATSKGHRTLASRTVQQRFSRANLYGPTCRLPWISGCICGKLWFVAKSGLAQTTFTRRPKTVLLLGRVAEQSFGGRKIAAIPLFSDNLDSSCLHSEEPTLVTSL